MKLEKKRGPQRRYDNDGKGAPGIFVRLEPELHDWVKSQEDGTRWYIERLIREDMEASKAAWEKHLAWQRDNPEEYAARRKALDDQAARFAGVDLMDLLKASMLEQMTGGRPALPPG